GWFADLENGQAPEARQTEETPATPIAEPASTLLAAVATAPDTQSPAAARPRTSGGSSELTSLVEELRAAAERQFGPSRSDVDPASAVEPGASVASIDLGRSHEGDLGAGPAAPPHEGIGDLQMAETETVR